MKKVLFLLLFIPIFSFGQNNYQWNKIEKISFCDLSKNNPHCEFKSVKQIPKEVKFVNCNVSSWTPILSNLAAYKYDLLSESCYLLLITFKNGTIIPFMFFPKQKVIMDLRQGHWNSLAFKKADYNKVDYLFKSFIECLNDPKCKDTK